MDSRKRTAEEARLDLDMKAKVPLPATTAAVGRREMQGSGADGKKHSIDSDEEDEYKAEAYDVPVNEVMKDDDIEGQEDLTIERDGEMKITPFNLREEQEEGQFTKDGNFVWKKEKEIVDSWLDNVDWVKVKEMSAEETRKKDERDEEEDEAEAKYDELTAYKDCIKLMREGETVAKAIKRLGGGKKQLPKWRQKKVKETPEEAQNRELMMKLTGYADSILSRSGNMEIYEETFEKIAYKIKQMEPAAAAKAATGAATVVVPEGVDDDDALDMFADNLDKDKTEEKSSENKNDTPTTKAAPTEATVVTSGLDLEVNWEFKWAREDEKVHGPHSSEEMLEWQNSGFFDKGVYVRKVGATGDFLDGKRIDFDLYT